MISNFVPFLDEGEVAMKEFAIENFLVLFIRLEGKYDFSSTRYVVDKFLKLLFDPSEKVSYS